jgi:hypothetical protein
MMRDSKDVSLGGEESPIKTRSLQVATGDEEEEEELPSNAEEANAPSMDMNDIINNINDDK